MVASTCRRGDWAIHGRSLAVCVPDDTGCERYAIEPTPPGVRRLFDRVANATGLCCPIKLTWLREAHGAGGFFTPGLVAIGAADVRDIAFRMWNLLDMERIRRAFDPARRISFEEMRDAVIEFLVAHELGHAAQVERGRGMTRIQAEADADRHAGAAAEHLGWDQTLHELVAFAVGCSGPVCFHPSPLERVRHNRRGREWQRQFEQQQAQRFW